MEALLLVSICNLVGAETKSSDCKRDDWVSIIYTLCLLHRHRDRAPTPRSTGDGTSTGKG